MQTEIGAASLKDVELQPQDVVMLLVDVEVLRGHGDAGP
jgi:hypothetical protein